MRVSLKALSCLAVATAASFSLGDTILAQKTLADLSKAASTSTFARHNCDFVNVTTDSTGSPMATLKFRGQYASFGQDLSTSQDWSSYNMVQAIISNKESYAIDFRFIVMLSKDINNYNNAYTGEFELRPNETRTFIFNLNPDSSKPYGMKYLRPVLSGAYNEVIAGTTFRNLKTIYHWRISNQDSSTSSLQVSQLKLLRQNLVFNGIADAYGQYTDRTWTNKVKKDTDFATLKAAEMTDLSANPGTGETLGSKVLKGTSGTTWKIIKDPSGMMYFQHPNGRYFWSLGASGVTSGSPTPVEGRTSYFQSLPSQSGTFASAYMDRPTQDGNLLCFNFNVKNLITKYGSNYRTPWASTVRQRLASWGVNTLGIQCDDDFVDGSLPYTLIVDTDDYGVRLRTPHMLWGSMPDPYSTGFQTWMTTKYKADLAADIPKQNFMGVFVDNEISWGDTSTQSLYFNVPRGVLNSSSTQPAKAAFMSQLQSKYKNSISSLNTAWKSTYSSWTDFLNKKWLPTSYTSGMQTDFKTFLRSVATTYYSKVNAALGAAGVKALYLGSRFDDFNPEVVSAACSYVDVVSFNIYRSIENVDWNYLNSLSKPVLISEAGYGMKARGTFGGPATVFTEQDRASKMAEFLNKTVTQPNVIGVHWYSYADQPITGRWSDYENTGMGMVDIADNPYPETVQVLRAFSKNLYSNRG